MASAMNGRSLAGGMSPGRLPLFVAVSVLVNLGIAHAVGNFPAGEIAIAEPTPLRINLNVRAAPRPSPVASIAKPPSVSAKSLPSFETVAKAQNKIAAVDREPDLKSLPVSEPSPRLHAARVPIKPNRPKPDTPVIKKQKIKETTQADKPVVAKAVTSNEKTSSPIETATTDAGASSATVKHEARYRRQTPPVYPRRAYELGQQGTVVLFAEVLPSGRPGELKVAQSSGHNLLDKSALAAVRDWEFEPNSINGRVVATWVQVPVRFVIQ